MKAFTYTSARDLGSAIAAGGQPQTAFIAGGTTLIDIWKLGAVPAERLVDLNGLDFRGIQAAPGSLKLGSLTRMSDAGSHPDVVKNYPVVSQALLLSASPQIRNMASLGGNLLQRPRSVSYRNPDPALQDGPSRFDAIFGVTPHSAAPHPSDFAVAMTALDGTVRVQGAKGERVLKLADFYQVPKDDLTFWTIAPDEVITSIEAATPFAGRSAYVKIRDRASYQFAVVSAAAALDMDGPNIREARIAAGGVGTIPWRFPQVEAALRGKPAGADAFHAAVADIGQGATPKAETNFKIELLKRTVVRALLQAQAIV
jgi:xanthine dehydrogenase YagS FAD-binding subunit